MKTACPHCGQRYDVEERDLGSPLDCMSCGRRFTLAAAPPPEEQKPRHVKFVILGLDEAEAELNKLYEAGWRVVSQSTVFWREEPRLFRSEATREERIAFVLYRKD